MWTGFTGGPGRGNVESTLRGHPFVDPMILSRENRDYFPKKDLGGGYLGDHYPLCADNPEKMFLRKGTKYVYLGDELKPKWTNQLKVSGPPRANSVPRSLRRALLMPQVNPGSRNHCAKDI